MRVRERRKLAHGPNRKSSAIAPSRSSSHSSSREISRFSFIRFYFFGGEPKKKNPPKATGLLDLSVQWSLRRICVTLHISKYLLVL